MSKVKKEDVVKYSIPPQIKVDLVLEQLNEKLDELNLQVNELIKLNNTILKDDSWMVKEMNGGSYNLRDYLPNEISDFKQFSTIKEWFDMSIDVEELANEYWDENWEDIVSEYLYSYRDAYDFEDMKDDLVVGSELVEQKIRTSLRWVA